MYILLTFQFLFNSRIAHTVFIFELLIISVKKLYKTSFYLPNVTYMRATHVSVYLPQVCLNWHLVFIWALLEYHRAFLVIDANCHRFSYCEGKTLNELYFYHFWLGIKRRVMMAPWVCRLVTGSHLINSPSPLPQSITTFEPQPLHNIQNTHSQPTSLTSRLLFESSRKLTVKFC